MGYVADYLSKIGIDLREARVVPDVGIGSGPGFQLINRLKRSRCAGQSQAGLSSCRRKPCILSLIKAELPQAGELAYYVKNVTACGLCPPASPLRSASGKKGA